MVINTLCSAGVQCKTAVGNEEVGNVQFEEERNASKSDVGAKGYARRDKDQNRTFSAV